MFVRKCRIEDKPCVCKYMRWQFPVILAACKLQHAQQETGHPLFVFRLKVNLKWDAVGIQGTENL